MPDERVVFSVWCSNESKAIGELIVAKGKRVNVADIKAGFVPAERIYSFIGIDGHMIQGPGPDKKSILRDGTQALCPRCASPLTLREPGKTSRELDDDDELYLVPGGFHTSP